MKKVYTQHVPFAYLSNFIKKSNRRLKFSDKFYLQLEIGIVRGFFFVRLTISNVSIFLSFIFCSAMTS